MPLTGEPNEKIAVVIPAYNEASSIRATLESLCSCEPPIADVNVVVVDNASTDETASVVRQFSIDHPDFTPHLITEADKGTGVASNTGFRYGIDHLGAMVIARTDGDTSVSPNWLRSIDSTFRRAPTTKLVTGPVHPRKDKSYSPIDSLAFPISRGFSMGIIGLSHRTLPRKRLLTPGHNMATPAYIYNEVGGFPLSSIDDTNEDLVYRNRVIKMFGVKSFKFNHDMVVATSMRRMRQTGYRRLFSYYVNRSDAERRLNASRGVIDVREQ